MKKRNHQFHPIGDILKDFIVKNKLQKGFDKVRVEEVWRKIMGAGVNNYTSSIEFQNYTLYVYLKSSVLREELSLGKTKIIKMLNEELRRDIIKKIIFR